MARFILACACACALVVPASARAADYYISALGNDANAGTSAAPWRTLAPADQRTFTAGDRILLRGGDAFDGTLQFDAADTGTASMPIIVTSYGTGRATLRPATGRGIFAYNTAGIAISNLVIAGSGGPASGIVFYADLAGGVKLSTVRIDGVDVSGFGLDGIEIGSWNGTTGFSNVRITNVSAHDNARTGILTYAQVPNAHQAVYVGYSRAYNNTGIASATTNTGSGIVLGGVDGGTIERSVAHDNGRLCTAGAGPVGIWTYDSRRIVIQQNESYDNRTGGTADGGGFDLDQNVSDSVIQYNYSHGNDGAGYLLAHAPLNDSHARNTVRYNISEDDGRRNSYAAIEVWGRTIGAEIHNNTVFVSPAASGTPRAVRVGNVTIADRVAAALHLRNNIFVTAGGLPVLDVSATQATAADLRFEGNDYYASGAALSLAWGSATYATLAAWRATGQEIVGGAATGSSADPRLTAPGSGGTLDDATRLETVSAYRLQGGSTMVDGGLDLAARFGVDPGARDYYASPLPQGAGFDAGAGELIAAPVTAADLVLQAASAVTVAGAWRRTLDASAAGGARLWHPDAGAAKVTAASASPANYFELPFDAVSGQAYRLWIRAAAQNNAWSNDSVFVQFSGSVTAAGAPAWRIGTTSATEVNLEDCSGCGLSGWGWQDNGYGAGVLGPLVYFAADGPQTVRVQTREDGVSIDQIVLSPATYLSSAPGLLKNDNTILGMSAPLASPEVVRYAADVPVSALHGDWAAVADTTAAAGLALRNPNRGAAKILTPAASPASYVDVTFTADGATDYQVWLRMKAEDNSTANDSVYLQFSGTVDSTGAPVLRIGSANAAIVVLQDTTGAPLAGWGWNDSGWAGLGTPVRFAAAGPQTLRIQQREDGVSIDQIVISARKYLTTSPGKLTNDTTVITR
jgi:hypothetical protein